MDSRGPSWNKVEMGAEKQGEQGRSCWKGTLKWKQPKCPSTESRSTKRGIASHTMAYYSTVKRNETLIHAIPWRDTENIMVSEGSQTQKASDCVIMFILNF